ncbi:MAG: L-aspartate oxidase [Myxococcota bacterium]
MSDFVETDFLVIGSGLAGLTFALDAARHGTVAVVTKRAPDEGSTRYAQGGIASVFGADDSFESHVEDTLRVGAGLCRRDIVEIAVHEGPAHIRRLVDRYGVAFARAPGGGGFDLGREGGHSRRRIVHSQDATGAAVERALVDAAQSHDRIRIFRDHLAVDLLTMAKYGGDNACFGAYVLDQAGGAVHTFVARATLLATGGCGKVYLYTSNPDVATGDGVAMAYRAGATVANMEFFQFHPTCLYHPQAKSFLLSEALRGEGAVLRLRDGTLFMKRYHADADLAPRDVVARAIDAEMKRTGDEFVLLDCTPLGGDFLNERFPNLAAGAGRFGYDLAREPVPVVPAAHYSCGGVVTDERGRTTLRNLYAAGETACTGLHGACRLASNSLLEALVFAARAADDAKDAGGVRPPAVAPWVAGSAVSSDEAVVITQNWDEVRRTMWNYVGIVRSDRRLERARRRIELIREEIREYYWNFLVTGDLLELRNLALCAHLIVESARRRKESRGLHMNIDYPEPDDRWRRDTELRRGDGPPT